MRTSKITVGTLRQPRHTIRGLTNKVYYVWHILDNKCLYKTGVYSKSDAKQQLTKWLEVAQ